MGRERLQEINGAHGAARRFRFGIICTSLHFTLLGWLKGVFGGAPSRVNQVFLWTLKQS